MAARGGQARLRRADQPHLADEFRDLAGVTPGEYLRSRVNDPNHLRPRVNDPNHLRPRPPA